MYSKLGPTISNKFPFFLRLLRQILQATTVVFSAYVGYLFMSQFRVDTDKITTVLTVLV